MNIDARFIVQGLVNNSFAECVCFVCLMRIEEFKESIFTKVCKEDMEYCVADILRAVFNIQFADDDQYNVCPDCFIGAFSTYKYHLQVTRSQEVLHFYSEALTEQINVLEHSAEKYENVVCVELPEFEPDTKEFNIDIGAFASHYVTNNDINIDNGLDNYMDEKYSNCNTKEIDVEDKVTFKKQKQLNDLKIKIKQEIEDDIIVVKNENNQSSFYEINDDGDFVLIDQIKQDFESDEHTYTMPKKKRNRLTKFRKQRLPMDYMSCTECPIKYRFQSKLKTHMKLDHNIDLFICGVCKKMMYCEIEYYNHLNAHNQFICGICGIGVKKRSSLISHINRHERVMLKHNYETHICEVCGQEVPKIDLKNHSKKHTKKFICNYCGKAYKGEMSLESHVKKHESYHTSYKCSLCDDMFDSAYARDDHLASAHPGEGFRCTKCDAKFDSRPILKLHEKIHRNFHCEKCSKSFVDARALMWHQRLHTGERPYLCNTCGRSFISANRRNQHSVCAHTEPTRRCPLCPALFHLRSMVNSHIRKVHLKDQHMCRQRTPRWNRSVKHRDVFWRTEVVPLEELSVAVQNELLQLQTSVDD